MYRRLMFTFAALIVTGVRAEPYKLDQLASLESYLIENGEEEIALALSAAPAHISEGATVLVLTKDGYKEARRGSNGFVCLVERSWAGKFHYEGAFWDPMVRSPNCYNSIAAEYVLPLYMLRTRLALSGSGRAEIAAAVNRAVSSGELAAPRGLAMSYMLSGGQYLHPDIGRWKPHIMIWVPYMRQEDWGPNPLAGKDPVVFRNPGGPFAMVVIPYGEERFITP